MIPTPIVLTDCAMATDGGSTFLAVEDAEGKKHKFIIPQHMLEANFKHGIIPARLYFDGKPVDVRSEQEKELLAALKEAKVPEAKSEEEDLSEEFREMAQSMVDFVQSEKYVQMAGRFEKYALKKADGT